MGKKKKKIARKTVSRGELLLLAIAISLVTFGLFGFAYTTYVYPVLIPQSADVRSFPLAEGGSRSLSINLPSESRVIVVSNVTLRVWVDGKLITESNLTRLKLREGIHEIRVQNLDGMTEVRIAIIKEVPEELRLISLILVIFGSLEVAIIYLKLRRRWRNERD